ncbi:MAG TPA: sialidase family protein [Chthonomonadales bacterium]|nr:sialidase family protein [Chthonomonadales bacterium]
MIAMIAAIAAIAALVAAAPAEPEPAVRLEPALLPEVQLEPALLPAEGAKGALALRDGSVLAVRTEPHEGGMAVVCFRSTDGGRSWSRMGIIARANEPDADIGDGCFLELRDGTLLHAYRDNRLHGRHAAAPTYAIRVAASTDGGRTWRPHSTVEESRPVGPGPSRGLWSSFLIETRSGALQCYYDDEYTPNAEGFRGHQWLRMRTWDPRDRAWVRPVTVSRAHRPEHLSRDGMATVIEVARGHLLCVFESVQTFAPHANVVRWVESRDGGRSWSWERTERGVVYEPRDRRFMALAPWVARMPSGALICVFVTDEDRATPDRSGTPPPYLNMDAKLVVSRDGGRTWSAPVTFYAETHRAYMPGIVPLKEPGPGEAFLALVLDTRAGFRGRRGRLEAPRRR